MIRHARFLALLLTGLLADTSYICAWMFSGLHNGAVSLYRVAGESWWRHEEPEYNCYYTADDESAEEEL